jgi:hypothetical protein
LGGPVSHQLVAWIYQSNDILSVIRLGGSVCIWQAKLEKLVSDPYLLYLAKRNMLKLKKNAIKTALSLGVSPFPACHIQTDPPSLMTDNISFIELNIQRMNIYKNISLDNIRKKGIKKKKRE